MVRQFQLGAGVLVGLWISMASHTSTFLVHGWVIILQSILMVGDGSAPQIRILKPPFRGNQVYLQK